MLTRFILIALIPLTATVILVFSHYQAANKHFNQQIRSAQLNQDLSIQRDKNGLVYINSGSDRDAYFGLGYAHAQDRLWQLELQRRITKGSLSELFGKSFIDKDIWIRTLGLQAAAESSWQGLSDDAKAALTAYKNGVNTWLNSNENVLPLEFVALDFRPALWTEVDSLAIQKMFALNLSGNMWQELHHMIARQYLDDAVVDALFPNYQNQSITAQQHSPEVPPDDLSQLLAMQSKMQQQLKLGGRFIGSNAWVISTDEGNNLKSILANDPHLNLQIPSRWHFVRLQGQTLDATGATLVGLPAIIFGYNKNIAWGATNMGADTQDLYLEEVNPENPAEYRDVDGWQPFKETLHTIAVKADTPASLRAPLKPVSLKVRSTSRGPIINDLFGVSAQPISLRWTALDADDASYQAFFEVNYADNWQKFKSAFESYAAPTLNMLYADNKANIGYLGVGKIPIRKNSFGQLPNPGQSSETQWQGYIPFAQMPQKFNPKEGYIVSANHDMTGEDYPYFVSADWAEPYRAQRIAQLIENQNYQLPDLEAIQKISLDTLDTSSQQLLAHLKNVTLPPEISPYIEPLTVEWDGEMAVNSNQASLFFIWAKFIKERLLFDELDGSWGEDTQLAPLKTVAATLPYDHISRLLESDSAVCDDQRSEKTESCDDILLLALNDAIAELGGIQSVSDPDSAWGEISHSLYEHTPFSHLKILDDIFEREVAGQGVVNAINVSHPQYQKDKKYVSQFGAGFRHVIGFTEEQTEYRYVNSTGQSGNLLNPNYDDMIGSMTTGLFYRPEPEKIVSTTSIIAINESRGE
ncbi:MAG: penicillin acylase family protein [Aestuariibacter sp.]